MPHILIATDFSDASLNAARFAITHFGGARTRFTLVHSFLDPRVDDTLMPDVSVIARKQAFKSLRSFERKCMKLGGPASFARVASSAWLPHAINDVASEQGADLVIMGTHGAGENALFGSVSTEVVVKANIPVVLVPRSWEPGPIKRIMLAHDGGPMDRAMLAPLQGFAKRKKAEVVVAHVRNNSVAMDRGLDRRALKGLLPGTPFSFVTAFGDSVAATIDELAAEGRIQFVVAIHRQRGFWKGLLHRSKAKRMALHTHVPLMVLR